MAKRFIDEVHQVNQNKGIVTVRHNITNKYTNKSIFDYDLKYLLSKKE